MDKVEREGEQELGPDLYVRTYMREIAEECL